MEIKQGSSVAIKRLSPNGVVIGYDLGEVQEIEQVNDQARYRVARDGVDLGRVFEKDLDLSVMALLGCIPKEPAVNCQEVEEDKTEIVVDTNPGTFAATNNPLSTDEQVTPGIDPSQDPVSPSVEFQNEETAPVEGAENVVADPSEPTTETPTDPVDPSLQNGENPNAPKDPSQVNPEA